MERETGFTSPLRLFSENPEEVLTRLRDGCIEYLGAAVDQFTDLHVLYALKSGLIDECAAAMPQLGSNSMKAIAVMTRNRSPLLPSLASAHEQGLNEFDSYFWSGIFLPKDTPAAIVQKLHDASVAALNTPAVAARLKDVGADLVAPERRSPEYLQKFVASEIEKWAAPIKASGVEF